MTNDKRTNNLTWKEKVSYSLGDCAGQIYVTLASFFLTGYYTDTVGISAVAIGTMMIVARVFDGTTDLLMGAVIDKTRSKYGKTRIWILRTTPLMAIALVALFHVPTSFDDSGKLIYVYITYILLNCIIYTANGIAYNSLLSRMTYDVQERCSATSLRFVLGSITTMAVNAVTALLVEKIGWGSLVLIYAFIEAAMLFLCFAGCKEHLDEEICFEDKKVQEKVSLKVAILALLKNKYFFLQTILLIFLYINIMSVGSMTYYYCNTILGSITFMTIVTLTYNIPTIVGSLINPVLVLKMGKRNVLMISFCASIIGRIMVGIGTSSFLIVLVGIAIHGFALGPIYSNIFAMTPDIVDYGEWKTGIRSEGLITSCVSFGMKVGIGLGGATATWILAFGGYNGLEATQSIAAQLAIRFGFGYMSAILSAVCLIIVCVMNLDKKMEQIQTDLITGQNRPLV